MVSSHYLLRKTEAPSGLKQFLDQRVIPATIDGAACVDMALVNASQRIRQNPVMAIGLALGIGASLAFAFRHRRRA